MRPFNGVRNFVRHAAETAALAVVMRAPSNACASVSGDCRNFHRVLFEPCARGRGILRAQSRRATSARSPANLAASLRSRLSWILPEMRPSSSTYSLGTERSRYPAALRFEEKRAKLPLFSSGDLKSKRPPCIREASALSNRTGRCWNADGAAAARHRRDRRARTSKCRTRPVLLQGTRTRTFVKASAPLSRTLRYATDSS